MKKELDYFTIEGCYGGNQDWFTNLIMHMGGCAAATACDSCIYFGLQNEKMKPLYPFNIECLTKEDYKAFSQIMKPYLNHVLAVYGSLAGSWKVLNDIFKM